MSVEESARLATRWFEEGRVDDARRLLALLQEGGLEHPQLTFLAAQIALADGDVPRAVRLYRGLLSADPGLIRVRLELARALFLGRDFDAARYHFEVALGEPDLPQATRANIREFLRRIDAQTTSLSFAAMVVPDSNANQATGAREVDIFGQTFRLNEDATAKAGTGLVLYLQGRRAFGSDYRSFLGSAVEHRNYPGRRADFTYAQATAGHAVFLGESVLGTEAGPLGSIYQGRRLYTGALARLSHTRPLGRGTLLGQSLLWRRLSYQDFPQLDGHQWWLGHDLRVGLDSRSALSLDLSLGSHSAGEQPYSFHASELRLGYLRELGSGILAELRVSGNRYLYRAPDPLFRQTRHDRQLRFEIGVTLRDWNAWGFAPRLAASHTDNDSSLALHAYRRTYYELGVTREF